MLALCEAQSATDWEHHFIEASNLINGRLLVKAASDGLTHQIEGSHTLFLCHFVFSSPFVDVRSLVEQCGFSLIYSVLDLTIRCLTNQTFH